MIHGGGWRKRKLDGPHRAIVKGLRDAGRQVLELDGVKGNEAGVPDILVLWRGGFAFMELKAAKGKLSDVQSAWHARYRGPAGTLFLVRTLTEALALTGVVSQQMTRNPGLPPSPCARGSGSLGGR